MSPSDSLNLKKQKAVFAVQALTLSGTLIGLNQLWYADYPKSKFHFINDNAQWLQVDKLGHVFSSYQIGRLSSEMLEWSGTSKKNQLVYGASLGLVFLTAVEVMDGGSKEWGASSGDIFANAVGTGFYVSQELMWKEQRIIPKFSFHTTQYAQYRPTILGSSFSEQILKDYNGQTYWISINLHSFFKRSRVPKWLNFAIGYGGDGMLTGNAAKQVLNSTLKTERFRQLYVSFDVDLTKIETNSAFLKTIFSVFSVLKIPAPTLEYSRNEGLRAYLFYF